MPTIRRAHLGVLVSGRRLGPGVVMNVDYRLADLGSRTRLEYNAEVDTEALPGPLKLAIPLARVFTFFQLRYFIAQPAPPGRGLGPRRSRPRGGAAERRMSVADAVRVSLTPRELGG